MAYTDLVLKKPDNGAAFTLEAALAAGQMWKNIGKEALLVNNGGGAPINVTFTSVACEHGRTGNLVVAVANGTQRLLKPPGNPSIWNQASGANKGKTLVDYSAVTTVTVALIAI